jgi:membrane fusion protein
MSLFRTESLNSEDECKLGRPISAFPISWIKIGLLLIIIASCIVAFLINAKFVRKESASGVLHYSRGELRIVTPKGGIVRKVLVEQGQTVNEGDSLAFITTEQQLVGGGKFDETMLRALDAEQSAFETRLAALDASSPLEQRALSERLTGLRNQLPKLQESLATRLERLAVSKSAFEAGKDGNARGFVSGDSLRQRQYDFLAQEQAVADLRAQIAQMAAQIAENTASLAKLPSDAAQARAGIRQQIVALEERRADAHAAQGFVLSAPSAGRVTALQARVGQPADPSKPLMTIVPEGSDLVAEIYVPSRAIGFIEPGQKVRLMYDAFPHERFGQAAGTVREISSIVLKPEEISEAVVIKEPVYRVLVAPEKASISAYGKDIPLRSGMALTADILLDKRSFMSLLLDPLIAAGNRTLAD